MKWAFLGVPHTIVLLGNPILGFLDLPLLGAHTHTCMHTHTHTHTAPNAPTGVAAVPSANGDPYRALDVSWVNPTMANGVLLSCIIDFSLPIGKGNSVIVARNGEVPQNTTLNNLMPGTRYVFTMHCFSGRDIGDPGVQGETSTISEATTTLGGK